MVFPLKKQVMKSSPPFALYIAPFLLILLHRPHVLVSPAQTNLTAGSMLTPPNNITSPSGDFAFGFRAVDSNPNQFLLAVWFSFKAADSTQHKIVWFAKDTSSEYSTVIATALSVLKLTSDGLFFLTDRSSGNILWSPKENFGALLVLQDSGNLQLLAGGGDVPPVWESFQQPTDTLLSGQSMTNGMHLLSKLTDTDYVSPGRFRLDVQTDGNIVLYMTVDIPSDTDPNNAYWNSATNGKDPTLFLAEPGNLHYKLKDGTLHNLTSLLHNSSIKYYQYAALDPDGIVRVYVHPKKTTADGGETSWVVASLFPGDGCGRTNGFQGMCGPNAYCIQNSKGRLDCQCPPRYVFVDPRYRYTGCMPSFVPQSCAEKKKNNNNSAEFELVELLNTTWATSMYYKKYSTTEEQCRDNCLNHCFCAAALFDGSNCVEMGQLTAGWNTSSTTAKTLIKVRRRNPRALLPILPYIVVAGALVFLLMATTSSTIWYYCISKKANQSLSSLRVFTRKELHKATNGFQKLLGKGGFGEVYQGVVKALHRPDVAVKKLISSNECNEREFTNEVQSIGRIHHKNLVRMIGYCKEGKHRMLVFEFMPNGSLRGFIFRPKRPPWSWRAEVALGIARGLEYLHDGCVAPIIHCDIKPDNILLDDKNVPKITDFGIAKLLGNQQLQTTVTNIRGTRGYIAPEWFRSDARIDTKADVYSFGAVLLEMICCRKCQEPVPEQEEDETVTLFGWASQLVSNRMIELMLPRDDTDAVADLDRVERFARVAFSCIEQSPLLRPTMHQVVQMLEGIAQVDERPIHPPIYYLDPPVLVSSDNRSNSAASNVKIALEM